MNNQLSPAKRIFLFADATTYMLSKDISYFGNSSDRIHRLASIINLLAEFGFICQLPFDSTYPLLALMAYHLVAGLFFSSDIENMAKNYFSIYSKTWFGIYLLLFCSGIFLFGRFLWLH